MKLESDTIECVVKYLKVGDVEDPDIYVAQHIWEWQQTEEGKWIMEHSDPSPMWKQYYDPAIYGHQYSIHAFLKGSDYTFWSLKYK